MRLAQQREGSSLSSAHARDPLHDARARHKQNALIHQHQHGDSQEQLAHCTAAHSLSVLAHPPFAPVEAEGNHGVWLAEGEGTPLVWTPNSGARLSLPYSQRAGACMHEAIGSSKSKIYMSHRAIRSAFDCVSHRAEPSGSAGLKVGRLSHKLSYANLFVQVL